MSIYATLWSLKFPRSGDYYTGCEWIKVTAQGVPPHIGSPTPGLGYEDGDPYAAFLPEVVATNKDGEAEFMRAVVIVTEDTVKGTSRNGQEYIDPLMTLSGQHYSQLSFQELYEGICEALRGGSPRMTLEIMRPDGDIEIHFEDGTFRSVNRRNQ
jgi:hypothetical protein